PQPDLQRRVYSRFLEMSRERREVLAAEHPVDVQERLPLLERAIPLEAHHLELLRHLAVLVGLRPGVPVAEAYPLHRSGSAHVGELHLLGAPEPRQGLDHRLAALEPYNIAVVELLESHVSL